MAEKKVRFILDGIEEEKLAERVNEIDKHSEAITKLVAQVIKPATADLDDVMAKINNTVKDGDAPLPILEDLLLTLTSQIYRTTVRVETIGVQADMSRAVYTDEYQNAIRNATGTVQEKAAKADIVSQYSALAMDIRSRAYKIGKGKLDAAENMMNALRKVITSRITERERSNNEDDYT